jgi:hypothetical protein
MTMSMAIPEQQLEHLMNTMRQERQQAHKKPTQIN